MGAAVIIETQDTGVFGHEEADVTIISYVLQAVGEGKNVVCVLCDDTDVFVLLCSGCGGTSLWTSARCIWSAGMERYSTSIRRALNKATTACSCLECTL